MQSFPISSFVSASGIQRKRQQFRSQIRKQKIDKFFLNQRLQVISKNIQQKKAQLETKLQTTQDKRIWLQNLVSKLFNKPNSEWSYILVQILRGIQIFKRDYELVLSTKLIQKICQSFNPQYWDKKIFVQSCKILIHIPFNYQVYQGEFISVLKSFNIPNHALNLLKWNGSDICDKIQLIILLSEICLLENNIKKILFKHDTIQYILQLKDQSQQYEFFSLTQAKLQFIKSILNKGRNQNSSIPSKNNIKLILGYLQKQIILSHSQKLTSLALQCLIQLTNFFSETICCLLVQLKAIIINIIHQLSSHNQSIKQMAFKIVSNIIYSINNLFLARGDINIKQILDTICKENNSIKKQQQQNDKAINKYNNNIKNNIRYLSLNIFVNLMSKSNEFILLLLNHECFQIVINILQNFCESPHQTSRDKQFKESIFCISTICMQGQYKYINLLFKRIKVMDLFMDILRYGQCDNQIVIQVLESIQSLARVYNNVISLNKNGQKSIIINKLKEDEKIFNILEYWSFHSNNKKIRKACENIIDFYHQSCLQQLSS